LYNRHLICILFSFRDNVPAVLLEEWDLQATMWEGDTTAGLVPTLFADNIQEAAFLENTARSHADLQKLARSLFMPEVIDLEEAKALIKKPR